jgi:hypothetical protein
MDAFLATPLAGHPNEAGSVAGAMDGMEATGAGGGAAGEREISIFQSFFRKRHYLMVSHESGRSLPLLHFYFFTAYFFNIASLSSS